MQNTINWFFTATRKALNFKLFDISSLRSKTLVHFILILIFTSPIQNSFAQSTDNKSVPSSFGGAVTVTNNGISFIPTFSLGKPAVIFDMAVGRKLTFEPQFRFSLEGKP